MRCKYERIIFTNKLRDGKSETWFYQNFILIFGIAS